MKKLIMYGAIFISIAWINSTIAYIFEFSNHTHDVLRVRVQLLGVYEGWVEHEIPAKQMRSFVWVPWLHPRQSEGLDMLKAGLCLQNVQVATPQIIKKEQIDDNGERKTVYEPLLDQSKKPVFNPWRDVSFKWVKNEAYDAILAAGNAFADGFADLASAGASAALTVATGGVPIPMPEFKLSGITNAIGTWVAYGTCRDMHFDIVLDADLSFPTEKSYKFLVKKG